MLDLLIFFIRGTSQALGILLTLPISWAEGYSIQVYHIVIFIALLFLFIKLFAMITKNSVVNKKG